MQSSHILSILYGSLASLPKINLKKSGQVKMGKSGAKILKYLFKLALFSSKGHQAYYFLSTFMTHVIHFWNPQVLENSDQKFKTMPFWRKNWENQYLNCFGLSFSNRGSTSLVIKLIIAHFSSGVTFFSLLTFIDRI